MDNVQNLDPLTQAVIINATMSLLSFLGRESSNTVKKRLSKNKVLSEAMRDASSYIVDFEDIRDDETARRLKSFLASSEVESIIRQVYAAKLTGSYIKYEESIRDEFSESLALFLDQKREHIDNYSKYLFDALIEGCEIAFQITVEETDFTIDQIKEAQQINMLQGELSAIRKNLDLLVSSKVIDIQEILKFEEKYRQQVSIVTSTLFHLFSIR